MKRAAWTLTALAATSMTLLPARRAEACGCFTPPDPSVPVVQAGERILFATQNGQVTAHIQIQYQGDAKDFGWLLPLPSVPTLELGVDELFNQLTTTTQPKYKLNKVYEGNCSFDPSKNFGRFNTNNAVPGLAGGGEGDTTGQSSPLVIQSSIGPYDYAVLKADDQSAMLKWLSDNRYFVPVGTTDSVSAYIHTGAYFLALKLQSGQSVGDLQPVVVHYASDLPMIPIVLTSTGAKPDMGIQVWMLGAGRAIPRNYYHTIIDDAVLDWNNAAANYNDVIIAATKEADGRHTFVTEYAGPSTPMVGVLNAPSRFGVQSDLASMPDAISFINYLNSHQFYTVNPSTSGPVFQPFIYSSQLLSILGKYVPVPAGLAAQGITPSQFYYNISYYLGSYRQSNPSLFTGYTMTYDPTTMASDIWTRVVTPTLSAGALFDQFPYLTRLYTTLSPENMNSDPVFSFNPSLPDWSNVHTGTLTYHCGWYGGGNPQTTPATLVTEAGFTLDFPYGVGSKFVAPALPASQQIQTLSEEGPATVITDNTGTINLGLTHLSNGCAMDAHGRPEGLVALGVAVLLGGLLIRRRRRA
jgi:MYXO-CTERM domain-containing protein